MKMGVRQQNKYRQNMMKYFLKHWSSLSKFSKATAFSRSGTSCLKLPCDISQSVLRQFSCRQSHMHKRNISSNSFFLLLHSCHQQIKFKNKLKASQLKKQAPEMRFRSSKISDENTILINERCVFPQVGG